MNPETRYLENLESIERIAAFVARRSHLNADDTGEFVQNVRVRLFENDYAIIRKFEGRSSFSTYLTTVILRLFHEWRVSMWGKWRPSAEAKRLGDKAITLERLITRDDFTFDEAVKILTTRSGGLYTRGELEAIYLRLPLRTPRAVFISEDLVPDVLAVDPEAGERVETSERERAARCCMAALDHALADFDSEDKLILQLRFERSLTVPEIAKVVSLDQKKIYKRLDKLLSVLRRALEAAGVGRADVESLMGNGDHEIRLSTWSAEESSSFRPSNPSGGEEMRGGDRSLR